MTFDRFRPDHDGAANADKSAGARPRRGRVLAAVALSLALAAGVAACGSSSSGSSDIALVAYSTPEGAYTDDLIPGFEATSQGDGANFTTSFGPSGDQSRAVEAGQKADVVHFSLEPDMQRLVDAKLVADDWNQNQYKGIVEDSVVVFVVRKGNPDNIQTWDDVVQHEVITPNPFQSGGAKWNLMAAYGAKINEGASPQEAQDFLAKVLGATSVQDASARDALNTFINGKGDVLLSYENDAIAAQQAGEDVDYVIPDDTILIQTPIATTVGASQQAQDFVDYLYTDDAQQLWADNGYRPVVQSVFDQNKDKFPTPPGLFTIDDLGGWSKVNSEFFDPEGSIVQGIEQNLGVATS
jgi:sulfate/thiosulfate transport system substrate-binding protein